MRSNCISTSIGVKKPEQTHSNGTSGQAIDQVKDVRQEMRNVNRIPLLSNRKLYSISNSQKQTTQHFGMVSLYHCSGKCVDICDAAGAKQNEACRRKQKAQIPLNRSEYLIL